MGKAPDAGRREGLAAPSETLRIGVVGVNGRGGDHLRGFIDIPGVQIAAICDVDEGVVARRVKEVVDRGKPRPQSEEAIPKLHPGFGRLRARHAASGLLDVLLR